MGIIDGSPDSSVNRGFKWIKYVLIGGFVLLFAAILFYMYRSVGYIGVNRSYRCVEDDITLVDGVNGLFDYKEGVMYGDSEEIAVEATEALAFIEERGECLEGYVRSSVSELSDKQISTDEATIAYLDMVLSISESEDPESEMSEMVEELDLAYTQFRTAVSEYEAEVSNVEGRFFLLAL